MDKDQNQQNAEAEVVKTTTTTIAENKQLQGIVNKPTQYYPQAIPTVIKFSSRASVKIVDKNKQDHYYTIEYGEERQIKDFDKVDIDKERQFLIDDCNNIVDGQVKEIVETFLR